MLFLQDQDNPVHFKGDIKEEALSAFVSKHASLWIGNYSIFQLLLVRDRVGEYPWSAWDAPCPF
jgi:hypothetical protein